VPQAFPPSADKQFEFERLVNNNYQISVQELTGKGGDRDEAMHTKPTP
jgi:hypothetical protein